MVIPAVKRRTVRGKKIIPRRKAADDPMTVDQELKRSMLECIDRFLQEIDTRCEGMGCVSDRFTVLEYSNQIETSETELPKFLQSLVENYNERSAAWCPYKNSTPKKISKGHQRSKRRVFWLDFLKILRVCG
ncbi:hypothetical protein AVEN_207947-1 [Araneus ventricosus]|uniref:Uncharacterized protein n=1 Tax=Araneus ventricosus TaxID=182803 RepID=A0A4Y2SUU2_ARAVE|nr:hypothetical protein AVEN_207947-1 [Araneus ventricosus]